MLSTIFNSALAELSFYLVCGGSVGVLLALLLAFTFRNRIIQREVDRRIPEITEEYRLAEVESSLLIVQYHDDIIRYKRINAEMVLHAGNLVKASLS